MPDKRTIEKARRDKREGKAPSTQAGEFVREEIDKIRHGEHGARSTKQVIAIGLSEARRAGSICRRRNAARPPSARARELNMLMRQVRASASRSGGRGYRAR